jgi:hypothetical protein
MLKSLHVKCPLSLSDVTKKLEFSPQIFGKSSNTKFHQNPSGGSRVVPYRSTDKHDEGNSRFSQFLERA